VSAEASEMVTISRAELDSLRAEVRRLRREVGRTVASARILEGFGHKAADQPERRSGGLPVCP
jgi:hypothetical protein